MSFDGITWEDFDKLPDEEKLKYAFFLFQSIQKDIDPDIKEKLEQAKNNIKHLQEQGLDKIHFNLKKIKFIAENPDNFILPVSKVSKEIVEKLNEAGRTGNKSKITTLEYKTKKGKKVSKYAEFSIGIIKPDNSIKLPRNFTKYHDIVQMAVGTILETTQKIKYDGRFFYPITAEQVIRLVDGLSSKDRVTPERIHDMENTLKILNFYLVDTDITKDIKNNEEEIKLNETSKILDISKWITSTNRVGNSVTLFLLNEKPIIYRYSKGLNQVRTIKKDILKIKGLRTSKQNTVIKIWLLQQIESMKPDPKKENGTHRSNTINIQNMFDSLQYDLQSYDPEEKIRKPMDKRVKSRFLKQIITMFEYWKSIKYITAYKKNMKNKSLVSITVYLEEEK